VADLTSSPGNSTTRSSSRTASVGFGRDSVVHLNIRAYPDGYRIELIDRSGS